MRHSIRWRLPLSYAGVALLAALALGAVLLVILRGYYAAQERGYLAANAQPLGAMMAQLPEAAWRSDALAEQIGPLAFLAQARVARARRRRTSGGRFGHPTDARRGAGGYSHHRDLHDGHVVRGAEFHRVERARGAGGSGWIWRTNPGAPAGCAACLRHAARRRCQHQRCRVGAFEPVGAPIRSCGNRCSTRPAARAARWSFRRGPPMGVK